MKILRAGLSYFALVFAAGFLLGTIRTLFLVPRIGERNAELLEMPVMLAVTIFAARWIVRRFNIPYKIFDRLGFGFIALVLLLLVEFTLVLWLRGISISEYFATRDPVSGAVYYAMLLVFALMPIFVGRK
jgi:ABC-type uncharacterized transport system permease subunit